MGELEDAHAALAASELEKAITSKEVNLVALQGNIEIARLTTLLQ